VTGLELQWVAICRYSMKAIAASDSRVKSSGQSLVPTVLSRRILTAHAERFPL